MAVLLKKQALLYGDLVLARQHSQHVKKTRYVKSHVKMPRYFVGVVGYMLLTHVLA